MVEGKAVHEEQRPPGAALRDIQTDITCLHDRLLDRHR
jgi:hypothetical protein